MDLFVRAKDGQLATLHDVARGAALPLISPAFVDEIASGSHKALAEAARKLQNADKRNRSELSSLDAILAAAKPESGKASAKRQRGQLIFTSLSLIED